MNNGTPEVKIVMVGKDGHALLGKHFHILEDNTNMTFETNDPESFRKYLFEGVNAYKDGEIIVTYDENTIEALPTNPVYGDTTIAKCRIVESPIVGVIRANRTGVSVAAFEKFLYTARKYYDINGKDLYDQVRHLVVEKVTKIERKADNQGNYHLAVTRTGGKGDMDPTPTIDFNIPVFDTVDSTEKFTFDVHMEYKEIEGGVAISYSLVNPFFEEELKSRKKMIVLNILKEYKALVLAGKAAIVADTNAWQYKENGLN